MRLQLEKKRKEVWGGKKASVICRSRGIEIEGGGSKTRPHRRHQNGGGLREVNKKLNFSDMRIFTWKERQGKEPSELAGAYSADLELEEQGQARPHLHARVRRGKRDED